MAVHPNALVDSSAELDSSVVIGPFALIGPHVQIGAGSSIAAHAIIEGHTRIGRNNRVFSHAVIGGPPQDKKYAGEPTRLEIGDGNTIREFVTINTGTAQDEALTRVGDDNWIMAYVHIAHDCRVGDHTILANNVTLAGHVHLGDWVILGGLSAVHQFVRIGAHSMAGGGSIILQDIPPFVMAQGYPAKPHGLNSEGLRRRGFSADTIAALKRAYRALYRENLGFEEAKARIAQMANQADPDSSVQLVAFSQFLLQVTRGIIR
jgi:UDP-N-acetylglucosamine acyltransferase